jgi:UDP-N-acetylglucosamine 3-dehydrogenase
MTNLRTAVIGLGAMGRHHARIYASSADVELVGVADLNGEIASSVADTYGTRPFTDYRQLLHLMPDVVSVAVPTSLHREVVLVAADAGSNVMIEKPIADTLESGQEIMARCRQRGVKLMVGHVERFNPVSGVLKKSIFGLDVISIDITRVGPFPPRISDVGVVIDLAVHDIDILRYLTGSEFRTVRSLIGKNLAGDREDTALLSFEMENGVLCHVTTNWVTPFKVREITVAAREKLIKGWLIEQKVCEYERYQEDGSYIVRELPVPYGEPLELELSAFLDVVRNDEPPPVSGEDGLKALEVALRCLEQGGKRVYS